MRRFLKWTLGGAAALVAALFIWLATTPTPDTDWAAMEAKYGFADSRYLEFDGARLHWRDVGCKTCPPLVLVHGLGASVHAWADLEARLADRFRLVSLDLPAHGLSEARRDDDYRADVLIRAVEAVADAAGLTEFALVGHSLGGFVAWRFALARPERLEALAMIAPAGASQVGRTPPGPIARAMSRAIHSDAVAWIAERYTPRSFIAASLEGSVADPARATDEAVDRYWELLRLPGHRRAQIVWQRKPRARGAFDRLSTVDAPTLIVWGEDDRLLPATLLDAFTSRLSHAEVLRIDAVGHLPMEEAPDLVADRIARFVAGSP